MTPLDAAQAIIDSEKRVAELVELVKEAYEADPWCHDNDAICKPLPFEESDIALNLDRIMGKETHDER